MFILAEFRCCKSARKFIAAVEEEDVAGSRRTRVGVAVSQPGKNKKKPLS